MRAPGVSRDRFGAPLPHGCPDRSLRCTVLPRVLHGNLVAPRSEDEEAGLITEMKSVSRDVTVEIC
jgi:hypothetical protein